ncbi:hypothetical protein VNO77_34587 [Canavalia gladiata]|uniref:Uncharacterized protein n=1 Tax=Canavalia gladiata TaxID=3824 RepID=A0AAN9KH00_CANGL
MLGRRKTLFSFLRESTPTTGIVNLHNHPMMITCVVVAAKSSSKIFIWIRRIPCLVDMNDSHQKLLATIRESALTEPRPSM